LLRNLVEVGFFFTAAGRWEEDGFGCWLSAALRAHQQAQSDYLFQILP